jgi:hypothetical protein
MVREPAGPVNPFGPESRITSVRSALHPIGGITVKLRLVAGTLLSVAALVLVPALGASAHVHAVTPLLCTPAPDNAGANQTNGTPAAAANGGPISGVIPIAMGGNVPLNGGGFDAAVCH